MRLAVVSTQTPAPNSEACGPAANHTHTRVINAVCVCGGGSGGGGGGGGVGGGSATQQLKSNSSHQPTQIKGSKATHQRRISAGPA